jgi:ubiquinone/menaquinone biosynthesis C-methylase UbiE
MKISQISSHFNQRASHFENYSNWSTDSRFFEICTAPLKNIPNPSICLDLGCGSGWIAKTDRMRNQRQWIGLDISLAMLKYYDGTIPFILGDAHMLPFRDHVFSYVLIRSVLHYVKASLVLTEVKRVIRNDGVLMIAQKVRQPYEQNSTWYREFIKLRDTHSMVQWTAPSLQDVIRRSGFKIEDCSDFTERREADFSQWISRDGTIPKQNQQQIRFLVDNVPRNIRKQMDLRLTDTKISYNRQWVIIVSRPN